jgi:hypothetical protein
MNTVVYYDKAYVRIADLGDAEDLAMSLRQDDLAELKAASAFPSALESLKHCVMASDCCYVARELEGDKVICLFGYNKRTEEYGSIWLLGSDLLKKHRKDFMKASKVWLGIFQRVTPAIGNAVYAKNTLHIAWLRRLGFKFIAKHENVGNLKETFYEFVKLCAN